MSFMLTRRVRQRTFLLRPSKRTNRIVRYVLAVAQRKWNINVHAVVAMSNHWHVAATDPDGNTVDFQRDCHSFISRALNAHQGEFEAVWSSTQTSRVEAEQPDDLVDQIAYTMANPVESGLVRHGSSWPGVRRAWPAKPKNIRKPKKFFRGEENGGDWPAEATLEMARPTGYEELSDGELAGLVNAAIETREDKFREKRDRARKRFVGRRKILAQSRHGQPTTREPRFGISPRVACKDKWRRIERLQYNKRWGRQYDTAMAAWHAGDRDVVFPPGTYKMRVLNGVTRAAPPG